jgi:hypothetical protein
MPAAWAKVLKLFTRSTSGSDTAAEPRTLRKNSTWSLSSCAISFAYCCTAELVNGTLLPPVTPSDGPVEPVVSASGKPDPVIARS